MRGKPAKFVRGLIRSGIVEEWNQSLGLSYFAFRSAICKIAERCIGQVRDAVVIKGPKRLHQELELERPSIIIPIDDDDWLRPDIACVLLDTLSEIPEEKPPSAFWWTPGFFPTFTHPQLIPIGCGPKKARFSQAVNTAYLKSKIGQHKTHKQLYSIERRLSDHVLASRYWGKRPNIYIPRRLSIANKTVASLVNLKRFYDHYKGHAPKIIDYIKKDIEMMYIEPVILDWQLWAREYSEASAAVHRQLL